MVRRRQLLPQPEQAPAAVYQLMLDCWHQTAGRRPPFEHILTRLRDWTRQQGSVPDWTGQQGSASDGPGSSDAGPARSQPAAAALRSASLPRGSAPPPLGRGGGGSLPRPAAAFSARSTELVLARVTSSSSLPGSQIHRL